MGHARRARAAVVQAKSQDLRALLRRQTLQVGGIEAALQIDVAVRETRIGEYVALIAQIDGDAPALAARQRRRLKHHNVAQLRTRLNGELQHPAPRQGVEARDQFGTVIEVVRQIERERDAIFHGNWLRRGAGTEGRERVSPEQSVRAWLRGHAPRVPLRQWGRF